jgi:hypothetical protein
MISILDKFCDLILELAEKRNRILVKISDQAEPISDNLIKIAVFRNKQWKNELLDKFKICQTRKLLGKRNYPTKEEFFELLYNEYYEPEEPWKKSKLAIKMRDWTDYYKDSRDLHTPYWKNKIDQNDVREVKIAIKQVMKEICELLSKGEFLDFESDNLYSKEALADVDRYITYWTSQKD